MYLCQRKSENMKRYLFPLSAVIMIVLLGACGGSIENKLIGTWKVTDVQTDFKETEVTPEMLSQVVELQKQTHFRILKDSIMVIISNNNTHEATWGFNDEDQTIIFFFKGKQDRPNVLGKLEERRIVQESETPLGTITTYYEKE